MYGLELWIEAPIGRLYEFSVLKLAHFVRGLWLQIVLWWVGWLLA